MSVVSTANEIAAIDWNIVAAAIATLIVTGFATWQGLRKGKEKAADPSKSDTTSIVGASLIETSSVHRLSEELKDNTAAQKEVSTLLRDLVSETRRSNDLVLMGQRFSSK